MTTPQLLEQIGDLLPDTVALTLVVGWTRHAAVPTRRVRAGAGAGAGDDVIRCRVGRRPELHPVHQRHHRPAQGRGPLAGRPGGRARSTCSRPNCAGSTTRPSTSTWHRSRTEADPRSCRSIAAGGCSVVLPRFDPELMAETIRSEARHPHIPGADDHPSAARRRPRRARCGAGAAPDHVRRIADRAAASSATAVELVRADTDADLRVVRDAPSGDGAAGPRTMPSSTTERF